MVWTYISKMANDFELLFVYLFAISISPLVKCHLYTLAFFDWAVSFLIEFGEFLLYSGYKSFIRYMIFNHFHSARGLSSHSSIFQRAEILNFDGPIFQFFSFVGHAFVLSSLIFFFFNFCCTVQHAGS